MALVPVGVNRSALHVAARQVLLEALDALRAHREALILVGAQAVYLRSHDADFAIAAFTSDGDLTLDPNLLGPDPRLHEAMEAAGFALATGSGGPQPGKWLRTVPIDGVNHDIPVDLIVPARFAGPGRRGARIPPHPTTAAMRAPGLEVALADHEPMLITSLDPEYDSRAVQVQVAGVAALLVAKAHKIADRLTDAQAGKTHRLTDKDAGDVVRLMTTSNARRIQATLRGLFEQPAIADVTHTGLDLLQAQFGTRAAPGVDMAVRALAGGTLEESAIRDLCVAYMRALRAGLDL